MALPPVTIKPVSIQTPLKPSARGAFVTNDTTIDAIANDLKDLILTNYGERVVQYDFGANLRPIIFEQDSNVEQKIKDAITTAVQKWLPIVNITDMTVTTSSLDSNLSENEVHVKLSFSVGQSSLNGSVGVVVRG